MNNDADNRNPSPNMDASVREYLDSASRAAADGDIELAMHLYLTAYERSLHSDIDSSEEAVDGLRESWVLACELGERSLAEYIFEKLQPHLSDDEARLFSDRLRELTLDRLERMGLSVSDVENIGRAVTDAGRAEQKKGTVEIEGPYILQGQSAQAAASILKSLRETLRQAAEGTDAIGADGKELPSRDSAREEGRDPDRPDGLSIVENETRTYADIVGYNDAIRDARELGIGLHRDPAFMEFLSMMNARHGIDRRPSRDSLLFRSPAREDAFEFMMATIGELGQPAMRMRVEQNMQGIPVLNVMSQLGCSLRVNQAHTEFEGSGTLVLEDIDLWLPPLPDMDESIASMIYAQIERAARDALAVVRTAVDNPHIAVLATASSENEIPEIFYDLLEPFSCIDIDLPTPGERAAIWLDLCERHPSLVGLDITKLVRLSAHLPRYDIAFAAREAIDEAYAAGIRERRYVPVSNSLMFSKLANFHPIDSDEYRELEDSAADAFADELAGARSIDDLLSTGGKHAALETPTEDEAESSDGEGDED